MMQTRVLVCRGSFMATACIWQLLVHESPSFMVAVHGSNLFIVVSCTWGQLVHSGGLWLVHGGKSLMEAVCP